MSVFSLSCLLRELADFRCIAAAPGEISGSNPALSAQLSGTNDHLGTGPCQPDSPGGAPDIGRCGCSDRLDRQELPTRAPSRAPSRVPSRVPSLATSRAPSRVPSLAPGASPHVVHERQAGVAVGTGAGGRVRLAIRITQRQVFRDLWSTKPGGGIRKVDLCCFVIVWLD